MRTTLSKVLVIRSLMLVVLSATLFSFSRPTGAESYKVFLNDKLLFEQYVTKDAAIPPVSLGTSNDTDMLNVIYNHCGRVGSKRTLSLMSESSELKKWSFPDVENLSSSTMTCSIKDIKAFQQPGRTLHLVYASQELTEGVTLATISSSGNDTRANRK